MSSNGLRRSPHRRQQQCFAARNSLYRTRGRGRQPDSARRHRIPRRCDGLPANPLRHQPSLRHAAALLGRGGSDTDAAPQTTHVRTCDGARPAHARLVRAAHHRLVERHRQRAAGRRTDRSLRYPYPHHRRERDRQGAGRPLAPRQEQTGFGPLRRSQLRGHSLGADRKRTLRPRTRRLHLGHQTAQGQVRTGHGRYALHGRDRRHVARGPGQSTARASKRTRSAAWEATRTSTSTYA